MGSIQSNFESKFEGKEQQLDITEGDIFMDIQEVWVETISIEISTAVSREISRVIAEEKERNVEEGNQQFENECTECSKVQRESNQNKFCFR